MPLNIIMTTGEELQQGEKKEVEEGKSEPMGEKGCSEKEAGTNQLPPH